MDIDPGDGAPILGTNLHRIGQAHHPFAPITGDVIIDPALQGMEQGGFTVKTAAYNQGHPLGNGQPAHLPAMG